MKAARETGVTRIIIYSDSQLVTEQIKGAYEAREERLVKYIKTIHDFSKCFTDWSRHLGQNGDDHVRNHGSEYSMPH